MASSNASAVPGARWGASARDTLWIHPRKLVGEVPLAYEPGRLRPTSRGERHARVGGDAGEPGG